MNRLATGLATGTLLAVAACSSPEQGPSVAELRQSQEALVAPYASCVISNVVDTGEKPEPPVDGLPRDTVTMDVALTETPAAQKAREKYAEDDHFVWSNNLTASLTMNPVAAQFNATIATGDNQRPFRLHPRKDSYKDGTVITVYANTDLWGDGTEMTTSAGKPTKTTQKLCGRLVLASGYWQKDASTK